MTPTDSYPMPSFPMLAVADVAASQRWYEALGFVTIFAMPTPTGGVSMAHLRWARYADLLMRAGTPGDGPKGMGVTLTFAVLENIDAVAERARAAGAQFMMEIGDRPWNTRDFTIADPDGFALCFTYGPLRKDISFDEVMQRKPGGGG